MPQIRDDAPYDKKDKDSLLKYALQLTGKTLREAIVEAGFEIPEDLPGGKGKFGVILENLYFRIISNNEPEPDFEELKIELKAAPMKQTSKERYRSKERMSLNIIDYMELEKLGFEGSVMHKANEILIVFYLDAGEPDVLDKKILKCTLWTIPTEDRDRIVGDWNIISNKVKEGHAHELSCGDTWYLEASPKGSGKEMREQPGTDILAKQRAFSLKSAYMNSVWARLDNVEPIFAGGISLDGPNAFEDEILGRFERYKGMYHREILDILHMPHNPSDKGQYARLARRMIINGEKKIEEFEKAGIVVKTVRLGINGIPVEDMSFRAFNYDDIIAQGTWDESEFHETLESKFLFVVFQLDESGEAYFKMAKFWNMPPDDLVKAGEEWARARDRILEGNLENIMPASEGDILFVRAHARDGSDKQMMGNEGRSAVKKSFWINRSYVGKVLEKLDDKKTLARKTRDSLFSESSESGAWGPILQKMDEVCEPMSILAIMNALPSYSRDLVKETLGSMTEHGVVECTSLGFRRKCVKLDQFLESLDGSVESSILKEYLSGRSIKMISEQRGMDAAQVKESLVKAASSRPYLEEDKYERIFKKYRFQEHIFSKTFDEPPKTFRYLSVVFKSGKGSMEELLSSPECTDRMKKYILALKNDRISIDEQTSIDADPAAILEYILASKGNALISRDNLMSEYAKFKKTYDVPNISKLDIDRPKMERIIEGSDFALWVSDNRVMFFNAEVAAKEKLVGALGLEKYRDLCISAQKILTDNLVILEENRLDDVQALYSFLKKNKDLIDDSLDVKFIKVPTIIFGTGDEDRQMDELLEAEGPISPEDLSRRYEEKYGHRETTVRSSILSRYYMYLWNGIYDWHIPKLEAKHIDNLKEIMSQEWYTIGETSDIFRTVLGELANKYMNPFNLNKLGYRMAPTHVFPAKYGSSEAFFRQYLSKKDGVIKIDNDAREINALSIVLRDKRKSRKLIPISTEAYVSDAYLESKGVTSSDLDSYLDAVCEFKADGECFTLKSLREEGFSHGLEEKGFEDIFYDFLIKRDDRIRSLSWAKVDVYKKTVSKFSNSDLIESILFGKGSMDVFDILDILKNKYGIDTNLSQLLFNTRSMWDGPLYYNKVTERIYSSKDSYYQEIEKCTDF